MSVHSLTHTLTQAHISLLFHRCCKKELFNKKPKFQRFQSHKSAVSQQIIGSFHL